MTDHSSCFHPSIQPYSRTSGAPRKQDVIPPSALPVTEDRPFLHSSHVTRLPKSTVSASAAAAVTVNPYLLAAADELEEEEQAGGDMQVHDPHHSSVKQPPPTRVLQSQSLSHGQQQLHSLSKASSLPAHSAAPVVPVPPLLARDDEDDDDGDGVV